MLFALDYDDTFTEAPEIWDRFIMYARMNNHEVICVTLRYESEVAGMDRQFRDKVKVYATGRKSKRPFMAALGIYPNVWIDDMPEWIDHAPAGLAPEGAAKPHYVDDYTLKLEETLLKANVILGQADFKNGNDHHGIDEGEVMANRFYFEEISPMIKKIEERRKQ